MTPDELSEIEQRANVAKSVTGDEALESNLAWCANWQTTAYEVSGAYDHSGSTPYALCVAEETAELIIHAPGDIKALTAEVRRLNAVGDAVREMHTYYLGMCTECGAERDPCPTVAALDAKEQTSR